MKYILFLLSFVTLTVSAQNAQTFKQDTVAFRTCLWNYNIGTAMNVPVIMASYKTLSDENLKGKFFSTGSNPPPPGMGFSIYYYAGPMDGREESK